MSIKENSTVKVVTDNPFFAGLTGTGKVVRVYSDLDIAIVRFENGQVVKIPVDYLVEVEQKNENQETKIPEGAKRISKHEFLDAVMTVTSPDQIVGSRSGEVDPMKLLFGGMTVVIVGTHIMEELYQDEEEIFLTEDQLKDALGKGCSPDKVAASIDNKMNIAQVFPISMLSLLVLKGIIPILFGDGSDHA